MSPLTRTTKLHWLYFGLSQCGPLRRALDRLSGFLTVEGQEHPFETGVGPITKAIDERQSRYPWRKKQ